MKILAIESSCDETAVACLEGLANLRVSLIGSQTALHAPHGGVVPEVASRSHLEVLPSMVRTALQQADWAMNDVDAVAATRGPGLAPALLVGLSCAKGLALGAGCPFYAVNHIEAHLLSPFFGEEKIPAHVALVVSGGHTLLVRVGGLGEYEILGRTRDDAAGEAFDKVGKLLGLPYPGGIEVDRLADSGDPTVFSLPRGLRGEETLDFSFSGLKTAVRYLLDKRVALSDQEKADLCAAFRCSVVETLVQKACRALALSGQSLLGLSGGVSANRYLQEALRRALADEGKELRVAARGLHTDNAAMIAAVAGWRCRIEQPSDWDAEIQPRLDW
jgi:N6-L-threonylcarbamoyladenine synthase